MPLAGWLLLVATALIVVGLVVGLTVIVALLLRISATLADAALHLGTVPEQLDPLAPAVSKYTSAVARFRTRLDSGQVMGRG
jgi:hypothetical protein